MFKESSSRRKRVQLERREGKRDKTWAERRGKRRQEAGGQKPCQPQEGFCVFI